MTRRWSWVCCWRSVLPWRPGWRPPGGPGTPGRAGSGAGQGAMAGRCPGAAAALVAAALSPAPIALLPYDTGLQHWASTHVGHWTAAVGQWTPILGPTRLGYVAGNSAFA